MQIGGPEELKLQCCKASFKNADKDKVNSGKKFANRFTPQRPCQTFYFVLWRQFGGQSQPAGFANWQTFRQNPVAGWARPALAIAAS